MSEVSCLTNGCNQKHGHSGPHAYMKPSIGERMDHSKAKVEEAQRVIEQRGGFTAADVHKPAEEWSSREVRTGLEYNSRLDLGAYEAQRKAKELPPVTLEGLAAVISALSGLAAALKGTHEPEMAASVRNAVIKATEAATAMLTTGGKVK